MKNTRRIPLLPVLLAAALCGAAPLCAADAAAGATNAPSIKELKSLAAQKSSSNFKGGFAAYGHEGIDAAEAIHRQILAMTNATPAEKVEACRVIANCRLESVRDTRGALEILAEAMRLPDLTPELRRAAKHNLAVVRRRMLDYAGARKLFDELAADASAKEDSRRAAARAALGCVKELEGGAAAAAALKTGVYAQLITAKDEIDGLLVEYGVVKRGKEELAAVVNDKGRRPNDRLGALSSYVALFRGGGFDEFDKQCTPLIKSLLSELPNGARSWGRDFDRLFERYRGSVDAQKFLKWYLGLLDALPEAGRPSPVEIFDRLGGTGYKEFGLEYARRVLAMGADAKVDARARVRAEITVALFSDGARPAGALKAVAKALAGNNITNINARNDLYRYAAKSAMKLGQYDAARAVYAEQEKMLVSRPQRSLKCPFIARAPGSTAEVLSADFYKKGEKGLLDRKYGDNLQFLVETDAAITGRKITKADGNEFRPAEIFAYCDASGVNILLRQFVANMQDFLDGFAGASGYESYLATGIDAPYHFFDLGVRPNQGAGEFPTQYENGTGFRVIAAGKDGCTVDNLYRDDGIVTRLTVPWVLVFNDLPANGKKWFFEPIHWGGGGYSWGGSESVHNRSSFGVLVFDGLTPEALTAIKRRILPVAKSKFSQCFSLHGDGSGAHWLDPELGDRDFYFACLEPINTRLGKYSGMIKAGMTDAEVNEAYDNAAADMLNIEFIVTKLRRDYLDAKRMTE